jgi:ribosome-binding factor A
MSGRMDRVSEEFREVVAEQIQKLKDPRVGFVTVTGVRVSPDLRQARVFYTVLGDEGARKATAAALRSARSHLRTAVGHQIRLKFTPELEFSEDDVEATARRVDQILDELHRKEQEPANEDGDDG